MQNLNHLDTEKKCEMCNQTIYTTSAINKGTATLLSQAVRFIELKGINVFHPEKELLQADMITANMRGNLSHLSNHGLIAPFKKEPGNWVVTRKGFDFLNDVPVKRVAIIDKATKVTIGYQDPEIQYSSIINSNDEYWYQPKCDIVDGKVVKRLDRMTPNERYNHEHPGLFDTQ